jgi:hypothetical protein
LIAARQELVQRSEHEFKVHFDDDDTRAILAVTEELRK